MIRKERLIKTFIELVTIDSPSHYETSVAEELTKHLKELDGKVTADTYGNLIVRFSGKGEPLILSCHMDTVDPGRNIVPKVLGDKITSDGKTILGGDPKAGIAALLEAIESLKEDHKQHVPIEVVLSRGEEVGLVGASQLDYQQLTAKQAIILDGENEAHNIDIAAPGAIHFDVTIVGKGAHAGVEPEKGISAIKIASEIITQLDLGRIDNETTANIGLIEGGTARNAVPESATIKGEIRSRNSEKLEAYKRKFEKTFETVVAKYPGAKHTFSIILHFFPYELDSSHPLIVKVQNCMKELKITPQLHQSGGATDGNIFNQKGITSIVLGTGDFEPHTTREYVLISQMENAAKICRQLLTSL